MAASFSLDGDDLTVIFEWTKPQATVEAVIGFAAKNLFDKGYGDHGTASDPIEFDDLSNQDKLDLVYNHLRQVVVDLADEKASVDAQAEARASAHKHDL